MRKPLKTSSNAETNQTNMNYNAEIARLSISVTLAFEDERLHRETHEHIAYLQMAVRGIALEGLRDVIRKHAIETRELHFWSETAPTLPGLYLVRSRSDVNTIGLANPREESRIVLLDSELQLFTNMIRFPGKILWGPLLMSFLAQRDLDSLVQRLPFFQEEPPDKSGPVWMQDPDGFTTTLVYYRIVLEEKQSGVVIGFDGQSRKVVGLIEQGYKFSEGIRPPGDPKLIHAHISRLTERLSKTVEALTELTVETGGLLARNFNLKSDSLVAAHNKATYQLSGNSNAVEPTAS